MKKIYSLMVPVFLAGTIQAQTITSANMPVIGDSLSIGIISTMVSPGPGGTGQTWDFSGLSASSTGYFNFVDPVGTLFDYRFPNSNLCGVSWEDSYSYYDSQLSALSTVGYGLLVPQPPPNDTALTVYSDAETVVELPFQFNDMFTDNFAGDDIALNIPFAFTGELSVTADGTGTLITPVGTYANVVRYHLASTKTGGTVTTKDQYVWMSSGHRFWLMLTETTTAAGFPSELTWWALNPISVSVGVEDQAETSPLQLQSNIANNGTLTLLVNGSVQADISVFDLTGKRLQNETGRMLSATENIQLTDLSTGLYVLQVTTDQGAISERFVVR